MHYIISHPPFPPGAPGAPPRLFFVPQMNRLAAILPASNVLVDVDATSKKRAFEHAGLVFENQHAIARATVTDNLFARERPRLDRAGPWRGRSRMAASRA